MQYELFRLLQKMSKTYHEAQMNRRIFPSNQSAVRTLSDTVVSFCLHPIVRRLRAEGTSAFRDKEPAQPTRTVYPPSPVRYRDTFSAKAVSLPPQVTGRSYSARPTVVLSTPQGRIQTQAIRSSTVTTAETSSRRN